MKDTRNNIIDTSIELFNLYSVGNVRVQDIAKASDISPGNLTYHFRTKKELMQGVYAHMKTELAESNFGDFLFKDAIDTLEITKTYLRFQIKYRFFYRDIMEIFSLIPDVKASYKRQIHQIINFNRNSIYLSIGKGLIIPEPAPGIYESLAKNSWAILNSWLSAREILGEDECTIEEGVRLVMDLHYPFYSETGKQHYHKTTAQLASNIAEDVDIPQPRATT